MASREPIRRHGGGHLAFGVDTPGAGEVKRLALLILEHEELTRWRAAAELRALGHTVIEAHTINEAISVLESGAPVDVMYCNLDIPGPQSGRDFEAWLARNEPAIPVLLTSVDALCITDLTGRPSRAFIGKPHAMTAALSAIESLIALQRKGG